MVKLILIFISILFLTIMSASNQKTDSTSFPKDFMKDFGSGLAKEWWYSLAEKHKLSGVSNFKGIVIFGSYSFSNDTAFIKDGICLIDEGTTYLLVKVKDGMYRINHDKLFATTYKLERFDKKSSSIISNDIQQGSKAIFVLSQGIKTQIK